MTRFIALDPGHPTVYGAEFVNRVCVRLLDFSIGSAMTHRGEYTSAVIEQPSAMNTPNTVAMAKVLWTGCSVANQLSELVHEFDPMVWKGGLKKPIHHGRVWEWMTPAERSLFPANTATVISKARTRLAETGKVTNYSHEWHNHLDAVGIGMFFLLRIKRGGVKGPTNV